MKCVRCTVPMVERERHVFWCRHCGYLDRSQEVCDLCGGQYPSPVDRWSFYQHTVCQACHDELRDTVEGKVNEILQRRPR